MTAPFNDDLANAMTVPSGTGSLGPIVIDDATTQSGEPTSARWKSIWFKFYAGTNNTGVAFDTQGSPGGDADSGDSTDPDNPPPFGQLDTVMARYSSPVENPSFAQLHFEGSNDDAGGGLQSQLVFNVFAPQWYFIQVGVFNSDYIGSVVLNYYDIPNLPYDVIEVDECPVMVEFDRTGPQSTRINPVNEFGDFQDGYMEWYEPRYDPGELLVWIGIGDALGQTTPAGYTEVFNGVWDDAAIDNPSPRGSLVVGNNYPVNSQYVQVIVAYRITSDTHSIDSDVKGTISGLKYSQESYPLWAAPSSSSQKNSGFGVRVYSFELTQMGGDYPTVDNWPANPVKASTIAFEPYHRVLSSNQTSPGGSTDMHINTVGIPDVVADHIGNHIWMSLVMNHGNVEPDADSTPLHSFSSTMDLYDQFIPKRDSFDFGSIDGTSEPNGTIWIGDHRYNEIRCHPWLASRSYFEPFVPASWVPPGVMGNDTWTAENGFSDTTPAPGHSILAHTSSTGDDLWWDGGLGVGGVDFFYWTLTGGLGAMSIIIQGPEVHRPINDDRTNAYPITECPITIAECVFGQSAEPGETYDGLGTARNSSVWFQYLPVNSDPGVIIRTGLGANDPSLGEFAPFFTEYDSILIVYDSDMNVLASDDDGDVGDLSLVEVAVTGGETYYIQVAGYGGDEGRLLLTIESEFACGELAYWGVDASLVT